MSNPDENVITSKNDTREQVNYDLSSLPDFETTDEGQEKVEELDTSTQEPNVEKPSNVMDRSKNIEDVDKMAAAAPLPPPPTTGKTNYVNKGKQNNYGNIGKIDNLENQVKGVKSVYDADKAMILILLNRLQGRKTESDELRTKIGEMQELKELLEGLKKALNETDGALYDYFKNGENSNFKVDSGDDFQLNDQNLGNYPIYLNNLIVKYKELIKFILDNQENKTIEIADLNSRIDKVNKELTEKNIENDEIKEKNVGIASENEDLLEENKKLQQVKSALELDFQKSKEMIENLDNQLKDLQKIADGSVAKENMEEEINNVRNKLEKTISEMENLIIELKSKLNICEESKRKISENLDRLNKDHLKFVLGEIRKNKYTFDENDIKTVIDQLKSEKIIDTTDRSEVINLEKLLNESLIYNPKDIDNSNDSTRIDQIVSEYLPSNNFNNPKVVVINQEKDLENLEQSKKIEEEKEKKRGGKRKTKKKKKSKKKRTLRKKNKSLKKKRKTSKK